MILTVTINFALDLTYHVERYERGATARVQRVFRQAGGKGVNVARVLHELGHDVSVTGLAGGFTGTEAREELRTAGIRDELVQIDAESRITIMVVERDGQATGFSEPGPMVTSDHWSALRQRFAALVPDARAVVLSGSVPPGVPSACYAQLVEAARDVGIPVLLDADGEALARGVEAQPDIVKINETELRGVHDDAEPLAALRKLQTRGARDVVISQGARGLTAVTEAGEIVHAAPPEALRGNPTGAGDAASAALILGMLDATPWPARLADAAALSAAAVCAPLAGAFDAGTYLRLRAAIIPTGTM